MYDIVTSGGLEYFGLWGNYTTCLQVEELEDISDDMEFVEKLITEESVFPLPANVTNLHFTTIFKDMQSIQFSSYHYYFTAMY